MSLVDNYTDQELNIDNLICYTYLLRVNANLQNYLPERDKVKVLIQVYKSGVY